MTLFDANPYVNHPGLWPPADDSVLTDDQAAELLWPGPGMTTAPSVSAPVDAWGEPMGGAQSW